MQRIFIPHLPGNEKVKSHAPGVALGWECYWVTDKRRKLRVRRTLLKSIGLQ